MSVLRFVALAAVALAGYYALLFLFQRPLIYPAPRGPFPADLPRDTERIALAMPFGVVPCWFLPPLARADSAAPVILFFHGNAERAEDWAVAFDPARQRGYGVLLVEFPGYGVAAGSPSEATITATALAAYDAVAAKPGVDAGRIAAYGRSLGGGAAVQLAVRKPVRALILESSFTGLRPFAHRFLAPGFLVRDAFDSRGALAGYRGPLLVLHGRQDEIIPFSHGRALAAAVPGAIFVELDCGHNDCERPWGPVLDFLAERVRP